MTVNINCNQIAWGLVIEEQFIQLQIIVGIVDNPATIVIVALDDEVAPVGQDLTERSG